ncbi:MAG: alpha/beta hydrolase, partial [Pseudomonadota bacterium]
SHPTLVMTAEHDTGSTPAMARAIAAEIEGAETVIIPGLQHMGLVERPDLFALPVVEFFSRCDLRKSQ